VRIRFENIQYNAYVRQVTKLCGHNRVKVIIPEQLIHCKNDEQMIQKRHHSEHPVFMNSPAQTAIFIQRTFKKEGNNHSHVRMLFWHNTWHMWSRWYTSDILAFAPQWYQGLYSRVRTLLSTVCSQEVIPCFTSASTVITCHPGASQGFSER